MPCLDRGDHRRRTGGDMEHWNNQQARPYGWFGQRITPAQYSRSAGIGAGKAIGQQVAVRTQGALWLSGRPAGVENGGRVIWRNRHVRQWQVSQIGVAFWTANDAFERDGWLRHCRCTRACDHDMRERRHLCFIG